MKHTLTLTVILSMLVGCATTKTYKETVESYIGHPELELTEKWGPPFRVYGDNDTIKTLVYSYVDNVHIPATDPTYVTQRNGPYLMGGWSGGTPEENYMLRCYTEFTIRGGIINNVSWEGNNCK